MTMSRFPIACWCSAPALARPGDPARGSAVFERLCQACHRVGDRGHAVGPDLTATQFAEPEVLLTTLRWQPKVDVEALEIDLEELFREAHGEG